MLQIQDVYKEYITGDLKQTALNHVSLNLRDNEFVAILGPSGSGKTTLLNIIGGLDHYDSGDLIINGISTKNYKDRDWDSYRNHTIGFVFQSYNLIPHQSVLANVELALTIGGISRSERKQRALKALEEVGLGDQSHKKPNQMSGGQMQRVAIARALVNNPDILLADEPTGALDSETSIQVMELLKEVAKNRLVVMVTHNPELAEEYATRIVKLKDGVIIGDTQPYVVDNATLATPEHKNMGKASMSFFTSLALSFNNLKTKKGRTLLTSFAGSIGIIGIALILALSTGVNTYIADIQKETMTSYPITITHETLDLTGLMKSASGSNSGMNFNSTGTEEVDESKTEIYADNSNLETSARLSASITENDLTGFKQYLDDENSDIHQYLGENGVVYSYDVKFNVYAEDPDGKNINTNIEVEDETTNTSSPFGAMTSNRNTMQSFVTGSSSTGADNFSELIAGTNGNLVSSVTTDSYDVVYGSWPTSADEVVLVLDGNSSIPTSTLYQLGIISKEQYDDTKQQIDDGETPKVPSWSYEELASHTFKLIPACDFFKENTENGTFTDIRNDVAYEQELLDGATTLKISGIIRPSVDAKNANIKTAVAYTSALTDQIIEHTNASAVVQAQEADSSTNVMNGLAFDAATDEEKIEQAKTYVSNLDISSKASMYQLFMYSASNSSEGSSTTNAQMAAMQGSMDEATMAKALDQWLEYSPDDTVLLSVYDNYVKGGSYEDNLTEFGKVSYDAPTSISIYTDSFESKDAVSECITNYNKSVDEDHQITYTDYVALMTSSLTSIVNIISYVLIAFVAVSLIVSCIMIGIITHISVLERTKEIGILRAIGASKKNVSQVFNAETFIIGICSGLIGVGVSVALTFPINSIIAKLVGDELVHASLSPIAAGILILISIVITVVGGLLPAKKAAKMDPVSALRTE